MHFPPLLRLTLLLFPSLSHALVGINWKIDSPTDSLASITFPLNMARAPHESGYFFAQQFNFLNLPESGYVGIQPRPKNPKGESIITGLFSSFVPGTTTTDVNCGAQAPGVGCKVEFVGEYGDTYLLQLMNTKGTVKDFLYFSTRNRCNG
jgi:hypothetical protein